ncbi:Dabb family protein [Aestuariimicrobium ganziense]|uniref:Dabb family protein n=1 Tax=Aestuariimicrobium ganziense TaxID=2773677 RepID=UPI0019454646|nr:Dabb family protein [Aestuariimicrobium ganziense]
MTTADPRIQHTVSFRLHHEPGSEAERDFLAAAAALTAIPGVEDYQQLRQVSPKSDHTFWFTMWFDDQDAYTAYNEHPDHVAFVRDRWQAEVADFQELDFVAL